MIYWTDVTTQGSMIRRMHLNGSNVQVGPRAAHSSADALGWGGGRDPGLGSLPRGLSLLQGYLPFTPRIPVNSFFHPLPHRVTAQLCLSLLVLASPFPPSSEGEV